MISAAQRFRLGLFLAVGCSLLLIALGVVAGSKLLERWDRYIVRYEDVSVGGLEIGADVKYSGIRVGRVDDIRIDPADVATVVVDLRVRHGTPIKADCEASIVTMGITGMKTIEIRGGTEEAPTLPPGAQIPAGVSALEAITGRAEVVAEKVEQVLNNLIDFTSPEKRGQFVETFCNAANLLASLDTLLTSNQASLRQSLANLGPLTEELTDLTRTMRHTLEGLDSLLTSPALRGTVTNLDKVSGDLSDADLGQVSRELYEAARQANLTFTRIDLTLLKSREDILQSLESLREGMEYFNEFTRLIAENPSLILRGKQQEETIR